MLPVTALAHIVARLAGYSSGSYNGTTRLGRACVIVTTKLSAGIKADVFEYEHIDNVCNKINNQVYIVNRERNNGYNKTLMLFLCMPTFCCCK